MKNASSGYDIEEIVDKDRNVPISIIMAIKAIMLTTTMMMKLKTRGRNKNV